MDEILLGVWKLWWGKLDFGERPAGFTKEWETLVSDV